MSSIQYTTARQGFIFPFLMFAMGIYILLTIPKFSELTSHQGIIENFRVIKDGAIYIQGEKDPYVVKGVKNKELISCALDRNKIQIITIWKDEVKRKMNLNIRNKDALLQVAVDGEMIYYFDLSSDKKLGWIFIIWYRRLGRRDISIFGKWTKDFIWEQTQLNFTDAFRVMKIAMNIYQA